MKENVIEFIKYLAGSTKVEFNNLDRVVDFNQAFWWEQMYFVAGIWEKSQRRCNDKDIVKKKYFFIDIDIREIHKEKTGEIMPDEMLEKEIDNVLIKINNCNPDRTAVVNSWNWIHIYYCGTEREFDSQTYSDWVKHIQACIDECIKDLWYYCDPACSNIARLSRLPWSINTRAKKWYNLQPCDCRLLYFQPQDSSLFNNIELFAENYKETNKSEEKDLKKISKFIATYNVKNDGWVREIINKIPAFEVAEPYLNARVIEKEWATRPFKDWNKSIWIYYYAPYNILVANGTGRVGNKDRTYTTWEFVCDEIFSWDKIAAKKFFEERYAIDFSEHNIISKIPQIDWKDKVKWYVYPWEVFKDMWCLMSWELVILCAESNAWKAQPLDSLVLTNKWFVKMWDIKLWDYVIWIDWLEKRVYAIPSYWEQEIYKIQMHDWTFCEAWQFHEFRVRVWKEKSFRDIEVKDIKELLNKWVKIRVQNTNALHMLKRQLPIHPYTLWALIWDWWLHDYSGILFSTVDKEIFDYIILPDSDILTHKERCTYRIKRNKRNNKPSETMDNIRLLWLNVLSHNKFIPHEYLYSDKNDRINLLQWLMDTDWTVNLALNKSWNRTAVTSFSTSSSILKDNFVLLVKSLWWKCTVSIRQWKYRWKDWVMKVCKNSYTVSFNLPEHIIPFKLKRKIKKYWAKMKSTSYIKSIEYVWKKIAKCISVEDEMYITDWMIPTHNTTYAMDILQANDSKKVWFYINLEFDIASVAKSKWLFANGKKKSDLTTNLTTLTKEEIKDMEDYVEKYLSKFKYFNNHKWCSIEELIEVMSAKVLEWFEIFVVDTLSKIKWFMSEKSTTEQSRIIEALQSFVQSTWAVIIWLHHTNKSWEFSWTQKIKDRSNVFITMSRDEDEWAWCTNFALSKDKFVSNINIKAKYNKKTGEYLYPIEAMY